MDAKLEPGKCDGEGAGSVLRGLDCVGNPRDAGMVNEAIRRWPKRWRGQTPEMKEAIVADLDAGRRKARELMDEAAEPETALSAIGALNACARSQIAIEAQEQSDDHAEAGVGAKGVVVNNIVVVAANQAAADRMNAAI